MGLKEKKMEKNSYQDSCLGVRRVRPQVKGKMKIKKNENLVIQLKKNKKKKKHVCQIDSENTYMPGSVYTIYCKYMALPVAKKNGRRIQGGGEPGGE